VLWAVALRHGPKAVATRPCADLLDVAGTVELRKKCTQRVLPRHLVTCAAEQVEPLPIVDLDVVTCALAFAKQPNRDALKALPSESVIEVIDAELRRLAQNPLEILQGLAIRGGLAIDAGSKDT
jgi:hypothetical protein